LISFQVMKPFVWAGIFLFVFESCLPLNLAKAPERNCRNGVPYNLKSTMRMDFAASDSEHQKLCILCYDGNKKNVVAMFQTSLLKIDISGDDFTLYKGKNVSSVRYNYKEATQSWFNLLPWKQHVINLPTFYPSCVGVATASNYTIHFMEIRVDIWRVIYAGCAGLVFWYARDISHNNLFYYGIGGSTGVLGFLLILIYMLYRIAPMKKYVGMSVMAVGWSFTLYMMQSIWDNLFLVLEQYRLYVVGYVLVSAFISLAAMYRFQPQSHPRTKDLTTWTLQCICLTVIFLSSELREASLSIVLILLSVYFFPMKYVRIANSFWLRRFPPKQRLLTEDEYMAQGTEETKQAIEELRSYCRSPECKQWSLVTKLKSPERFAEFVEGSPHLTDAEVLDHDVLASDSEDITSDEDSDASTVYAPVRENGRPVTDNGASPITSRVAHGQR